MSRSAVGAILAKELREIARDRRAVFVALVLPLGFYPALLWVAGDLPETQRRRQEERTQRVGVRGPLAELAAHLEPEDRLELVALDPAATPGAGALLRSGEVAAVVQVPAALERLGARGPEGGGGGVPGTGSSGEDGSVSPAGGGGEAPDAGAGDPGGNAPVVRVLWLASSVASGQARARAVELVERWEAARVAAGLARAGLEIEPRSFTALESRDVATELERAAEQLGRYVPLLLILLVFSGGSFAALDLFAGEKERGTLETLLVQPVTVRDIAGAKFLATLAVTLAAALANVAGLGLGLFLGAGSEVPGLGTAGTLPAGRLIVVGLLLLPLAVFASAVLLAVSARVRTWREGQTWLLPLTVVLLLPGVLAISPHVELESIVLLVPVANVALAVREAVTGRLELLPLAGVLVATSLHAAVALRAVAAVLRREDVLLGVETAPTVGVEREEARERRALLAGAGLLLLVGYAGGWLQSGDPVPYWAGLALTLWGVVLVPALLWAGLARRPVREVLGLRRTPLRNVLLAPVLGASAWPLLAAVFELQQRVLPLPEAVAREFERITGLLQGHGPAAAFLLLALSPGICEEAFWRGAFQGSLRPGRPLRQAVISGIYFGAFHLSAHRFVPTALAGGILGYVRARSGSLLPCVLLHTTYNACGLWLPRAIAARPGEEPELLGRPLVLLASAAVLVAGLRGLRSGAGRGAEDGLPGGSPRRREARGGG